MQIRFCHKAWTTTRGQGYSGAVYAVGIQNIVQGYYAFQFVHIPAVDYREDFDLVRTHAFERHIKALIGVDVGKNHGVDHFPKLLVRSFHGLALELLEVDHSNHASWVRYQPGSHTARSRLLQCFLHRNFRGQRLTAALHDSYDLVLRIALS